MSRYGVEQRVEYSLIAIGLPVVTLILVAGVAAVDKVVRVVGAPT
jgi:hypothetical protein